mmetsp:Transcript_3984/g.8799  ORF Transcript_3984/g.8799 Transcript_3984/m.8799 type:complete len:218 (-) Transcript_3984:826-1479(-)
MRKNRRQAGVKPPHSLGVACAGVGQHPVLDPTPGAGPSHRAPQPPTPAYAASALRPAAPPVGSRVSYPGLASRPPCRGRAQPRPAATRRAELAHLKGSSPSSASSAPPAASAPLARRKHPPRRLPGSGAPARAHGCSVNTFGRIHTGEPCESLDAPMARTARRPCSSHGMRTTRRDSDGEPRPRSAESGSWQWAREEGMYDSAHPCITLKSLSSRKV